MALYVNTNVTSLNAQRNLNKATNSLDTTYARLSSGLRINSAKDDAAGLQIADRMTSQINGLNQGNRNANDGIAVAQTIEGAMDEITNMLQRVRTLAVESANGTNTSDDRHSIAKEVQQLSAEITRIACETTFGGKTVLNGGDTRNTNVRGSLLSKGVLTIHVGANKDDTISIRLTGGFTTKQIMNSSGVSTSANPNTANVSESATIDSDVGDVMYFHVSGRTMAEETIANVDKAIKYVDGMRADLGAFQNRLESTISNQSNVANNQSDARARIRDTDYAEESANLSSQSIIQQAASSMLTQANSRPQIALSLLG